MVAWQRDRSMKRALLLILAVMVCLPASALWAREPGARRPIVLEAEDAAVTRMSHTRTRLMTRVPHSGRAYWIMFGAGERLTFRFEAPAGEYFVWVRAWLDPGEATQRRRMSVTLGNRLIGYVDRGNNRSQGNWTWHRLGPAGLAGGRSLMVIKKLMNSPRPAAIDVVHLIQDPLYRPPGG